MKKNAIEVLIVGAGPTGLMMASQLALRRILFRIIDKNEDHTTQSRALVVQARSLEILDQMGIAEEAVHLGEKARAVSVVFGGRRAVTMPLGDIGEGLTPFPYLLILEQSKTEEILNGFLAYHGYNVERQVQLLDFARNPDSVLATVRRADGKEETIQADWLIGADGAHSVVREKLGIPFAGKTYRESLFVLDCKVSLNFRSDEMSIVFSDKAFTGFFPLPNGRCRVLGTVPKECEGRDSISFEDVATNFAKRVNMDVSLSDPEWISLYHSHHRAVSTFRKDRCFVAGDAAHIHSPVGAQGMNTGLQDAYNLAWKLALVVQGKAKETLLDTYSDERITIAHSLVRTTDRAFHYVNSQNPMLKTLRMRVMPPVIRALWPMARRLRAIRELGFKMVSEIGIHYRQSTLSQESPHSRFPGSAPKPGDRVPHLPSANHSIGTRELTRGTKFHFILFSGHDYTEEAQRLTEGLEEVFPNLIEVEAIPPTADTAKLYQTFGIRKQGYYFVRPDSYIGYRSGTFETEHFEKYLKQFLVSPESRPIR
jgi:2-polyprenyl-6-methoxyphenol hydroxylase-like FAD-dependent oxidoreductase